ncbi:MAG: hypothetical protein EP338_13790 [Bacteroidetes bacterium]|nr:MAG: hypothetical protein EP338_13790 [Bacteroidota bacterium]
MKVMITAAVVLFASSQLFAQKLGTFGSSVQKKVGPKTVRVPYTSSTTYLGYAEPGSEDAIVDGKKFNYIYVWIPAVAPEIGVRMMSPVPPKIAAKLNNPGKSPNYDQNKDSQEYFDTYITLEKSDIISIKGGITPERIAAANWHKMAYNDDNSEMPSQPSGKNYNSLMRVKSQTSDPLNSLTVGLYRIGFTTFKTGEVKGTFMAEVAAPVDMPGIIVSPNIEDLKHLD